jgi:O-antigen/teichoic acid export membrane protein
VVVVLRTMMAMPSTVLKATGHHAQLSYATVVSAVANVLLSIAAVKLFGMTGAAIGTLLPAVVLAFAYVLPRACTVVGLTAWDGYRQIVWPAVWPIFFVGTLLAATRHLIPATLTAVFAHLAFGGLLYAAIFFLVGLDRQERQWFSSALNQVWRRSRGLATA